MRHQVFYCHPCLIDMGMERRRIRTDPIEEACPLCKRDKVLFCRDDYQAVRLSNEVKQRIAEKVREAPRVTVKSKPRLIGGWPENVRFD